MSTFFFLVVGANNFYFFCKYTKESCNDVSIGCSPVSHSFNWPHDGRTFHLAFICIIFKIKKHTIFPAVWFSLSNYHCWRYLLSELWFALLDCGHHHVTHTSIRKVYSVIPWSPSPRWYTDFWLLCCQHSWSGLQAEDPRKSGISHQRTHHDLASTSWTPERDNNNKKALPVFNLHLLQP